MVIFIKTTSFNQNPPIQKFVVGSMTSFHPIQNLVLNRLVQFNVIRRYVRTNSIHTTHRLNALAAPPGIRV